MKRLSRNELDFWADIFGLRRRWFGLEPNSMLRRRLVRAIRSLNRDVKNTPFGGGQS